MARIIAPGDHQLMDVGPLHSRLPPKHLCHSSIRFLAGNDAPAFGAPAWQRRFWQSHGCPEIKSWKGNKPKKTYLSCSTNQIHIYCPMDFTLFVQTLPIKRISWQYVNLAIPWNEQPVPVSSILYAHETHEGSLILDLHNSIVINFRKPVKTGVSPKMSQGFS